MHTSPKFYYGARFISLLKVLRGTAALCFGLLLQKLQNTFANPHNVFEKMHLNAHDPILKLLINRLKSFDTNVLTIITTILFILASVRYIEAIGLWRNWRWAQWLAFFTSLIYIPFELVSLYGEFSFYIMMVLGINFLICVYLYRIIKMS